MKHRGWLSLAFAPLCTAAALADEPEPRTPGTCRVHIVDRHVSQHNSRWLVRYEMRHDGPEPVSLTASDITVDYAGCVANSNCRPHATPRSTHAHFALSESAQSYAPVIEHANERQRCRERITFAVSTGPEPMTDVPSSKTAFLPLDLAPGQTFWAYLVLEHDHFLYGTYDPLLGERQVELTFADARFTDTLSLTHEISPARPAVKLSTPAKERTDTRYFRSAPDSLYLAADIPGYQYFRFDDIPVRWGTTFRVSFWYLVAHGSEGTPHVRIMEYQDTPNAWYRLDGGGFDLELAGQGKWQHFEHTFTARSDATTIALDFRIVDANIGELWIDEVRIEPRYGERDDP